MRARAENAAWRNRVRQSYRGDYRGDEDIPLNSACDKAG